VYKRRFIKVKRILPPTYLWASIGLMVVLHLLAPLRKIVPWPWNLLGILPLALGAVINILADKAFHKAGTTVKPFVGSTSLITDGVFRICRNPMYLGFVLILLGIAVLMGTISPFLIVPLFAILMGRIFIRTEEKMLEERFLQTWLDYKM
jgi:protein-S-isoprenylcysteine O-methyltransferase Ste14